jgi:hypothetical protein
MSAAERQARHRARLRQRVLRPPESPTTRSAPRPARWVAAVTALLDLQEEYRAWLDRMPENLEGSPTAEKLQAIAEIDLDELAAIDPPRVAMVASNRTWPLTTNAPYVRCRPTTRPL